MNSISRVNSSSGSGVSAGSRQVATAAPVATTGRVGEVNGLTPARNQARFEEAVWVRHWGPDTVNISEQAREFVNELVSLGKDG